MRILITGGTGLVGRAVGRRLSRGHQLLVLSRQGKGIKAQLGFPCEVISWDGKSEISSRVLEGVEAIVHLAGANIAEARWTTPRKQLLRDSRIEPLEHLTRALRSHGRQLKLAVSASAVGFYGDRGQEVVDESSAAGTGFLADLCRDWEKAALDLNARRTLILRMGIVLSPDGGFLKETLRMFKRFGAARLGSGRQLLSWIYIEDLVEIVAQALTNPSLNGVLNGVAPTPVSNREITLKLAELAGCFRVPPVPEFVLRIMFGEMAEMLLSSQNVRPDKLNKLRWNYKCPEIDRALNLCVVGTRQP